QTTEELYRPTHHNSLPCPAHMGLTRAATPVRGGGPDFELHLSLWRTCPPGTGCTNTTGGCLMLRDPADAPSLWGTTNTPNTPDTPVPAQVSADTEVSGGTSDPHTPAPAPPQAPAPPKEPAQVAVADDDTPVKVGPGGGPRLRA